MSIPGGIVYVLDDEPEMVKALTRLLRARQFEVRGYTSVHDFLKACRPESFPRMREDFGIPTDFGVMIS